MIGTGSLSGTRSAVFSFHVQFPYRTCFARFHLALPINTVSLTMKTCPLRLHRLGIIRHCDDAPLSIQAFEQFIDQMTYTVHTHTHKTVPVTCCSSQVLEVGRWPSPAPGVALPARPSRQATASHPSLSLPSAYHCWGRQTLSIASCCALSSFKRETQNRIRFHFHFSEDDDARRGWGLMWTSKRGSMKTVVLMATPCPKSLHGKGEK